jgi:hypothetical protein
MITLDNYLFIHSKLQYHTFTIYIQIYKNLPHKIYTYLIFQICLVLAGIVNKSNKSMSSSTPVIIFSCTIGTWPCILHASSTDVTCTLCRVLYLLVPWGVGMHDKISKTLMKLSCTFSVARVTQGQE